MPDKQPVRVPSHYREGRRVRGYTRDQKTGKDASRRRDRSGATKSPDTTSPDTTGLTWFIVEKHRSGLGILRMGSQRDAEIMFGSMERQRGGGERWLIGATDSAAALAAAGFPAEAREERMRRRR